MKLENVNHIGVIGTGMIGASMAALLTGNQYKVTMLAYNKEEEEKGRRQYQKFFDDLIEKKKLTREHFEKCKDFLHFSYEYEALSDAEVIYECVPEDLSLKHEVYRKIEAHCRNFKAVASTTSAKSADDLAKGFEIHKDKILVAHPFYPPHLIPFVEIVKGEKTSDEAVSTIYDLLESAGRKPIVANRSLPGFVANRLQHALVREAAYLVDEGIASPADVDKALTYSFMPRYSSVGLFQHQDAAGLDMVKAIEDYLLPSLSNRTDTPDFIAAHFNKGELGMKTGKGIYDWPEEAQKEFHRKAAEPYYRFFNWDLPEVN